MVDDVGAARTGPLGALRRARNAPFVERLVALPVAPTVLAIVLALVTLPLTVLSIMSVESYRTFDTTGHATPFEASIGSVGAVLAGALVGGTLGGLLVRRWPIAGAGLALVTAWPAAVLGFAVLPGLLHVPVTIGLVCVDSCSPALELSGGLALDAVWTTYTDSLMGSLMLFGLVTLLVGGLAVGFSLLDGGSAGWVVGYGAMVVAVGSLNAWSIGSSGIAFLVLAVGVAVWAKLLGRPRVAGAPASGDGASAPGLVDS